MKYLLLQYINEIAMLNLPRQEAGRMNAAYMAYTEAMKQAGVLLANHGLRPSSEARTVRAPAGKQSIVEGPYAETKEQLGGYFLVEVPDLNAALSWTARCPGAPHGAIEVRPVWA
ncbi:MAG: YciI family protein [Gammaproteobacteria bacterium]